MESDRKSRTYRVSELPAGVDIHHVATLLSRFPNIGPPERIRVHSLASSLHEWDLPATKVATITFTQPPEAFADGKTEWPLEGHWAGLAHNIIVDSHFLGLTPLNEVDAQKHVIDCIAIPGLASHAFGSWLGPRNFMWLRDGLPQRFEGIRSMIYGYDTRLTQTQSFKNIDDIATTLVFDLYSREVSIPFTKSIIFLAHSLGGIVLKKALVDMACNSDSEMPILPKIKGILMFGVPSQGMKISHLLTVVRNSPNESLIKALGPQSSYLAQLSQKHVDISLLRTIRLVSFYETERTQLVEEVSPGDLRRSDVYEVLVERSSAIQSGSVLVDQIGLDKDHSAIIKFGEDDRDHKSALLVIAQIKKSILVADPNTGTDQDPDTGPNPEPTVGHQSHKKHEEKPKDTETSSDTETSNDTEKTKDTVKPRDTKDKPITEHDQTYQGRAQHEAEEPFRPTFVSYSPHGKSRKQSLRIKLLEAATRPWFGIVRRSLSSSQSELQPPRGFVYAWYRKGNKGYITIGFSSYWMYDYMERSAKRCRDNERARIIVYICEVPHPKRVETMIHREPSAARYTLTNCRCGTRHRGWFKVGEGKTIEVMKRWSKWIEEENTYEAHIEGRRRVWTFKPSAMATLNEVLDQVEEHVDPLIGTDLTDEDGDAFHGAVIITSSPSPSRAAGFDHSSTESSPVDSSSPPADFVLEPQAIDRRSIERSNEFRMPGS